jgi:1-acylglycerone phosphate reductase
MPTDTYARSVMRQILPKSPSSHVWEGFGAKLVWFASTFLPRWVMDYYFTREFGLAKLRRTYSKKNV